MLVGVDRGMQVMREETFGPTLPVMKVADAEEGIRLANDSRYGLSATVWTRDVARAREIARRLEVGSARAHNRGRPWPNAPEWTRTITGKSPHKALNLARLPIPPRAQRGRV